MTVEFLSRYPSYSLPLKDGYHATFHNGSYKTEDPTEIKMLREVVYIEKLGSNRAITEAGESDDTRISGVIHLELTGLPTYKLVVHGESINDVAARIKTLVELPQAQVGNRMEDISSIEKGSIKKLGEEFVPDFSGENEALPVVEEVKPVLPERPTRSRNKEKINV